MALLKASIMPIQHGSQLPGKQRRREEKEKEKERKKENIKRSDERMNLRE